MNKNKFYVYIYFDPRKRGNFEYVDLEICFLYEPYYVGKGKNYRYLDHLRDKRNPLKTNKINRIISSGFVVRNFIEKIKFFDLETDAFEYEMLLINKIKRIIDKKGPLTNMTMGGSFNNPLLNHPNIDEIINKRKGIKSNRKGKTYEEIYGVEQAKIEKEKREKSFFKKNRIVSAEIINKTKKTYKKNNNTSWNKGLKSDDERVKSYIRYTKYTLLDINTNMEYEIIGYKKLLSFLNDINKKFKLNKNDRPTLMQLQKNSESKFLKLIKKETVNEIN